MEISALTVPRMSNDFLGGNLTYPSPRVVPILTHKLTFINRDEKF